MCFHFHLGWLIIVGIISPKLSHILCSMLEKKISWNIFRWTVHLILYLYNALRLGVLPENTNNKHISLIYEKHVFFIVTFGLVVLEEVSAGIIKFLYQNNSWQANRLQFPSIWFEYLKRLFSELCARVGCYSYPGPRFTYEPVWWCTLWLSRDNELIWNNC